MRIGLIVAGILLLACVTWLATRVLVVKTDLEASQVLVDELQTKIGNGDFTSVSSTSQKLQQKSSSASAGTADLTWRAAELIPYVGTNLSAVRAVAESIDDLVQEVAVPAVDLAGSFDITARDPVTGGFDLTPLAEAKTIVASAQTVISQSLARVNSVDASGTVGPVKAAVEKLSGVLSQADSALTSAAPLVNIAGAALGAEGERKYVLAFQNNAESTALGGSSASYTLMSANDGAIAVAGQASSADFVEGVAVDVPVDQSAIDLYSDYLLTHSNTSTSRPDFPTAAKIIQAYWLRDKATAVDGVISVDPLALAQILKATGPITLSSGDVLSSDNAVSLLVNEIYFRYNSYTEGDVVDSFFSEAAAAVLDKVMSGSFDMKAMIDAITYSVDQGSIMMWSANPEEQTAFDGTRVQGVLPVANDDATVVGVYYRDTSASKIDYYLQTATQTTSDVCTAETPTFTTTVTLHSNLTVDQANDLPDYVKSFNFGAEKFRTQVFVYGPVGATVTDARVDQEGIETVVDAGSNDLGRPVAKFTADLAPGETTAVTATFTGQPGQYGSLQVRGTPMINPTSVSIESAGCN
ncbi:hypothetical protein PA27867_2964 [Cryobacterium arcticum]|uniref:DUF4012 domain-containing protein n=1 Tax=Cryobacterium arcticum TaxID=670052 RepID=A0A1B1BN10_9MICO|nr:hypothetical protein PA27867_2964 [Cryobacterium arcticum]